MEFSDTDAAGIMHFVAFFRMMEQAEHDLLRSVGLSVVMHDASRHDQLAARRAAKCDFQAAARFEDLLEIEVRIARLGERSVTYAHRFLRDGVRSPPAKSPPSAAASATASCLNRCRFLQRLSKSLRVRNCITSQRHNRRIHRRQINDRQRVWRGSIESPD